MVAKIALISFLGILLLNVIFLLSADVGCRDSAYDIKEDGFDFCLSKAKSFLNNFEPLETND